MSRNSSTDSSSKSMGMFGSKHIQSLKTEDDLRSGLDSLCRSEPPGNFAVINQEESDPSVNWKLPPVSPSDVYRNLSAFNLQALSHIKIKEKSVRADLTLNAMLTIPLIEAKHIKAALKAGYQYAHLGMVKIGLNALNKKGQKACVFSPIR